ncbi:nuclear transport factor 2-like protein [Carboxylicivirga marina]|uniref:SnoaL-like domain-containing protein n=1 Tax=Carboxylicivirga marina TaxID=2800988 RepID=A0ABS1HPY8_9BACT|nr:nuclear transport factor 2 family protein [Carboxylicivirga marina]MBK3519555.1 hypothetical protein [Carboxylicivirga marina]
MRTTLSFLLAFLFLGMNGYSQKKNGVVFSEHEAIEKTVNLWKAFDSGAKEVYLSYFADSVYVFWNGKDATWTKNNIEQNYEWWHREFENLKRVNHKPAFPDAIEYKEGGLWVQDWMKITGRHINTGINLNLHIHQLYSFNEDGKIATIVFYYNNDVFEEIRNSKMTKENGTLYINHPYIVTVRKAMNAFIDKDIDEWSGYYSPNATFVFSSMKYGESLSLEQNKESLKAKFFIPEKKYKVEQVGYPDCFHYANNDSYAVFSWWKMTIMKNKEKYEYVFMLSHDFNKDGKIIREYIYGSNNHLADW